MLGQVTGMHDFMAAALYLISSNLTYKKKKERVILATRDSIEGMGKDLVETGTFQVCNATFQEDNVSSSKSPAKFGPSQIFERIG